MDNEEIIKELYLASCLLIDKLHDTGQDIDPDRVNRVYKFHYRMYTRLYNLTACNAIACYRMP
jgi:hypothetical protein